MPERGFAVAELVVQELRAAIAEAGYSWEVRELPDDEPLKGLGWLPSSPEHVQNALLAAERIAAAHPSLLAPTGNDATAVAERESVLPASFDWRSRGVIGPVRDQEACGSCVSFAATGLVCAQAGIELGAIGLELSEADEHFCSSHGATCGGWNNGAALDQIRTRGVVTDAAFPYNNAFDSPPVKDPTDPEVWLAHCRAEPNRTLRTYRLTNVTAWTGASRKSYLANVGPLICGFTVYHDFDLYSGGPYRHVTGYWRGGHAVMVIGYNDAEQVWICRNSWGAGFGGPARPDGTGAGFFKIGYGECGIDDEPFFGGDGVIAPATLPMVTAVSRSADKLDAFAVGTDRGTYTAAWQPGDTKWRGWWPVQGGVVAPGTFMHGVSRGKDKLDIFAIGTDQGTYTAAWQPGDTSWRGWWRIQDGVVAPGTSIHAVSRGTDKLDIFAVGTDHYVYTAAWQAGDTSWRGWWRIGTLKVAPNTSVFGVSRSTDKLDIFAIGADQGIYTAAWQPGDTSWRGWWRIQGGLAAPGTSVHAVSRSTDKLDVFAVGSDRGVYTAAWQAGDTNWRGWWSVQNGVVAPNTSVFGVARSKDKLDIFAVGTNHRVYTAAWQPGDTSWRGWWSVCDFVAAAGTSVYPVSRSTDKLDIFALGADHGTYTAAWQPGDPAFGAWRSIAGGIAEGG
jgi:hypothetical protein